MSGKMNIYNKPKWFKNLYWKLDWIAWRYLKFWQTCTECHHNKSHHSRDEDGWWSCDHGNWSCNCGNNIGR